MARIMECPRCGAGIRHNDTQCWRCGDTLKSTPRPKDPTHPQVKPSPGPLGIKDVRDIRPREVIKAQPAVQTVRDNFNGRERELQDREKELRDTMDSLEAESQELEDAYQELEKERLLVEQARKKIKAREDDLDAMALVLQNALQAAEAYQTEVRSGQGGHQTLDEFLAAKKDLTPLLENERQRIRSEIEREMADQISRIAQLEAELKAVYDQIEEGDPAPPIPLVNVQEVIDLVTDEVQSQFGVGITGSTEDRRMLTHIERLDQLLSGGIPKESVILMNGPAGSMKTTLTYNILHNAAATDGIKTMFLSLEQDRESLIRQMSRLGMDRDKSLDNLMVVDLVDLRRSMEGQHGDWRSIIKRYVENVMKEAPFQVLALDSLESFMAMSEHEYTRLDVHDLFEWFRSLGLTTFIISETPLSKLEAEGHMELYVADGAFELVMKEVGDSHIQRWLRCVKMRGANIDPKYFCLMHAGGSFMLSVPMMRTAPNVLEP